MSTPNEHQKEINKIKRGYESTLIDIMFSLIDMEEIMEMNDDPIEEIQKKIEEIKEKIGDSLTLQ